jgi:hypothetical protein
VADLQIDMPVVGDEMKGDFSYTDATSVVGRAVEHSDASLASSDEAGLGSRSRSFRVASSGLIIPRTSMSVSVE